jgi:hypothetical protein
MRDVREMQVPMGMRAPADAFRCTLRGVRRDGDGLHRRRHLVRPAGLVRGAHAIMAVAHTSGVTLGTFGVGWSEPGSAGFWSQRTVVESHVLLLGEPRRVPDAMGIEALTLRFWSAAGLGVRKPRRTSPEAGQARYRKVQTAVVTQVGRGVWRWV